MSSNCGIYQIKNTITGDYYIGSSCDLRKRKHDHRRYLVNNKHTNRHLQNAWNKYGEQSFVFETILLCNTENKLYYEQILLDGLKPAYNMAICASAVMQGWHHSEETRAKLSETNKGKHPSEATRAKLRAAQKGGLSRNFGKHLSEETKRKLSVAHAGLCLPLFTEEHKRKIGEAQKGELNHSFGKHLSEEHKSKISEANKGERHHNFGKHLSDETRTKISEAQKLSWAKRSA